MRQRENITDEKDMLPLRHLSHDQIQSYEDFIKSNNKRGLDYAFNNGLKHVASSNKKAKLIYKSAWLGTPDNDADECRNMQRTYQAPLYVDLEVQYINIDSKGKEHIIGTKSLSKQNFGMIPVITDQGSFVLTGMDYVVASQVVRSSGIEFSRNKQRNNNITARIIPELNQGSWLSIELNQKDATFKFQVDGRQANTFLITTMLRALGYSSRDMMEQFYEIESHPVDKRLIGRISADDVYKDIKNDKKQVIVLAGDIILEKHVNALMREGYRKLDCIKIYKGLDLYICNTLRKDKDRTKEKALRTLYKIRHTGEMPSVSAGFAAFENLFFNSKFNLGETGRVQINRKLELNNQSTHLDKEDICAILRKICRLDRQEEPLDDILSLSNRVVKLVNDHMEQAVLNTLKDMSIYFRDCLTKHLNGNTVVIPNTTQFGNNFRKKFQQGDIVQLMDAINPLRELSHKRRLTYTGPGGIKKDNATLELRDTHPSHFGRICLAESPEGENIGIVNAKALYLKVDEYGFPRTPYWKVSNGRALFEEKYLAYQDEHNKIIAKFDSIDSDGRFKSDKLIARLNGEIIIAPADEVDYVDVSPKQLISAAISLIPFLNKNDMARVFMGANMQGQAVPLLQPEAPFVGTGMEEIIARDSGYIIRAKEDGIIDQVGSDYVSVRSAPFTTSKYRFRKISMTKDKTCCNFKRTVSTGEYVKKGDILANGPSMDDGELALGRNVLVAFMPWYGYNFEDSIVVSDHLVKQWKFSSIHIDEFETKIDGNEYGEQIITREVPNVSQESLKDLDESGIIKVGSLVKPGSILVGKVNETQKRQGKSQMDSFIDFISGSSIMTKDQSLYAPEHCHGRVLAVKAFTRDPNQMTKHEKRVHRVELKQLKKNKEKDLLLLKGQMIEQVRLKLKGQTITKGYSIKNTKLTKEQIEDIPSSDFRAIHLKSKVRQDALHELFEIYDSKVLEIEELYANKKKVLADRKGNLANTQKKLIKVYIGSLNHLQPGDKMSGRHGNKGVISKVVPRESMPHLADGRVIDIVLNPLGVPSRMNTGQICETHIGWACDVLSKYIAIPPFSDISSDRIMQALREANLPSDGQVTLYDGLTGEPFDNKVTVGIQYMIKLNHLVEHKLHARSAGRYAQTTQQPLQGKAMGGGQRVGEMEFWALMAYGAAHNLQEITTVKSDDVRGRISATSALFRGSRKFEKYMPESFKVLLKELQGLGHSVNEDVHEGWLELHPEPTE